MLSLLKLTLRNSLVYSIGTVFTKIVGFILLPIYTNTFYISHLEYGMLGIIEASILILTAVFGQGFSYGYERWYYDKASIGKQKSIFFSIQLILLVAVVAGLFISVQFSSSLASVLFGHSHYQQILILMAICAGMEILVQLPNKLLRLQEKAWMYTWANIVKLIVHLGFILFFIIWLEYGLTGIFYAQILSGIVYFSILASSLIRSTEIKFEWQIIKDIVSFQFPLVLSLLVYSIIGYSDQYFITFFLGYEELGIYSLGVKLVNFIKVLVSAYSLAITPTFYKIINTPGNKRFYAKTMTYLCFVVCVVVLIFLTLSKEIILLMTSDPAYYEAYSLLPILCLGLIFVFIRDAAHFGLVIAKKTSHILATVCVAMVIGFLFNYIAVSYFQLIGVAVVVVLVQLIFLVMMAYMAHRVYPIPYEWRRIAYMIGLTAFLTLIIIGIDTMDSFVWRMLGKLGTSSLFPVVLYFTGFYEDIELERIRGFWKKWKRRIQLKL